MLKHYFSPIKGKKRKRTCLASIVSTVVVKLLIRACERSVSRAENGAERAENRLERSGAASGQNLTLKIRSTIKPLKVKKTEIDFKTYHENVNVNSLLLCLFCRK